MSKAFTRDGQDDGTRVVPPRAALPEGVPNYVTARGHRALRSEHEALARERAAAEGRDADDSERARSLAILGDRLAALDDRIATAELVAMTAPDPAQVRFGATVVLRDEHHEERTYRIVGVDEADVEHGSLAFVAPLARALLGHVEGDVVRVRTPRGHEDVTLVAVRYERDATPAVEALG